MYLRSCMHSYTHTHLHSYTSTYTSVGCVKYFDSLTVQLVDVRLKVWPVQTTLATLQHATTSRGEMWCSTRSMLEGLWGGEVTYVALFPWVEGYHDGTPPLMETDTWSDGTTSRWGPMDKAGMEGVGVGATKLLQFWTYYSVDITANEYRVRLTLYNNYHIGWYSVQVCTRRRLFSQ